MVDINMILQANDEFERMWTAEHGDNIGHDSDEYRCEREDFVKEYLRDAEQAHNEYIELLEEEQHKSGFYVFQDKMEMWRRER